MARKELPEVNASSLADIAFLLLTFFLIATSMDKAEGIQRALPDLSDQEQTPVKVQQQNVIEFVANAYGQVLYKEDPNESRQVNVAEVKDIVKKHVDNGAGTSAITNESCNYCQGAKNPKLSDHPHNAVISVKFDKGTNWESYMALQGQIEAAYDELRGEYVKRAYQRDWDLVIGDPAKGEDEGDNAIIKDAEEKYPKIIAEPKPQDANQ